MRAFSQTSGHAPPPAERKFGLPLDGGGRWAWACLAVWAGLAAAGSAQTMKLGPFALNVTGRGEVGYDSNVDGVYPEEEREELQKGDFYWMPGLTVRSDSVPMYPRLMLNLSAALSYQDYFSRNDLDTEIYNVALNFQTAHPRVKLGGMAGVDLSVDGIADQYVPGSASRDPVLTRDASVYADWNYRKLRVEGSADYSIELHQYEEYQAGDQEETTLLGGIYLDLFKWGSLFYSWENTVTTLIQDETETDETVQTFGIDGAVPVEILRRPVITYRLGVSYEEEETDEEEPTRTWEPTHTITVQDEFQLSKSIHLAASAIWENTLQGDDNEVTFAWPWETSKDGAEVTFQWNLKLSQQLTPRMQHSLTYTREPESTFASNSETETTTLGYHFSIQDFLLYGLKFSFSAQYETSTPLGAEDAVTEDTTTMDVGLNHTRQLSRRLFRLLAYQYKWETSNFHDEGAMQQHIATYGLTYQF